MAHQVDRHLPARRAEPQVGEGERPLSLSQDGHGAALEVLGTERAERETLLARLAPLEPRAGDRAQLREVRVHVLGGEYLEGHALALEAVERGAQALVRVTLEREGLEVDACLLADLQQAEAGFRVPAEVLGGDLVENRASAGALG